ncbi:hypothetical protein C0J52_22936 [Blattella germanica]|nr:hypothetical protein C0J52_22936 [Blattella germanica]
MLPPTVGYEKHDATRKRNPAYSMGVKAPMDLKKPGPAPYNLRQNQTRFGNCYSPAYSIGARTGIPGRTPGVSDKSRTPGPAAYNPAVPRSGRGEMSFGVRHAENAPPYILEEDNF